MVYRRHPQHVARRGFKFGPTTLNEIEYNKFNHILKPFNNIQINQYWHPRLSKKLFGPHTNGEPTLLVQCLY